MVHLCFAWQMRQLFLETHALQDSLIEPFFEGDVLRGGCVYFTKNGLFIGRAGHDLPGHRLKVSGGQVLQKLAAIRKLKTAAGILIGEHLPQMLDSRDLLGSEIELKSVWVVLSGDVLIKLLELLCIVRRTHPTLLRFSGMSQAFRRSSTRMRTRTLPAVASRPRIWFWIRRWTLWSCR